MVESVSGENAMVRESLVTGHFCSKKGDLSFARGGGRNRHARRPTNLDVVARRADDRTKVPRDETRVRGPWEKLVPSEEDGRVTWIAQGKGMCRLKPPEPTISGQPVDRAGVRPNKRSPCVSRLARLLSGKKEELGEIGSHAGREGGVAQVRDSHE